MKILKCIVAGVLFWLIAQVLGWFMFHPILGSAKGFVVSFLLNGDTFGSRFFDQYQLFALLEGVTFSLGYFFLSRGISGNSFKRGIIVSAIFLLIWLPNLMYGFRELRILLYVSSKVFLGGLLVAFVLRDSIPTNISSISTQNFISAKFGRWLFAGIASGLIAHVLETLYLPLAKLSYYFKLLSSVKLILFYLLEGLSISLCFAVFYKGLPGKRVKKGIIFGLIIWAVFYNFPTNTYNLKMTQYFLQVIYKLCAIVLGGIVISALYGNPKDEKIEGKD